MQKYRELLKGEPLAFVHLEAAPKLRQTSFSTGQSHELHVRAHCGSWLVEDFTRNCCVGMRIQPAVCGVFRKDLQVAAVLTTLLKATIQIHVSLRANFIGLFV